MRRVTLHPPSENPLIATPAEFGAAIRSARTAAHMSLADAALHLGIAKQTLSNLETAKGSVGLETALRAAAEFGVALFAAPKSEREIVRKAIRSARESK